MTAARQRILLVDDKDENLYYLRALLVGNGYEVIEAHHGAEALVRARQAPPDVVVSDLLMPVMDGYTLLRHWQADAQLKKIPFVVYTATYTEPEDEKLALDLGASAFVLKPSEPDILLAQIKNAKARSAQGTLGLTPDDLASAESVFKAYSQTLIRKLEEKTLQLEEVNRQLHLDIAKRERVERSLRDSEERFRQLAENINEVFWMTDPDKKGMLYVSPAYEKIWGRSCQSLYDHPDAWIEAIHPEDLPPVVKNLSERQSAGKYDETYRIIRPDGQVRWIHDRAYPVRREDGEAYRIVGTAEDITERKRLEAQFLRAQRMEGIGTLAGGIAHDLNNVLAPITMSLQLLKLKLPNPEDQELLTTLEKGCQRGSGLIKQVLAFARGVEGQRIAVNPLELIQELLQMMRDTFPKSVAIDYRAPERLWSLTGDPVQLHQVFLNLCVNARDAMPDGGRLNIRIENVTLDDGALPGVAELRPGAYVAFHVSDTGQGMMPEVRDRIFEPFFTTKEVGKGTGLGLPTSLAIIKGHRGLVDVASEPGKGTVFSVYLPADTTHMAKLETKAPSAEPPHGDGELILVVDDEESLRSIAQRMLERYGYRVLLARNGAEAISLYAQHFEDIAVVISDVAMPVMDGAAMVVALRAINPQVRVILSSGIGPEAHNGSEGVEYFVQKPYDAATLLRTLHTALTGWRGQRRRKTK